MRCSSELYWYRNEIGRRYKVLRFYKYGYVVELYNEHKGLYINYEDAEIIMPSFDDMMKYKLDIEKDPQLRIEFENN